METEVLIVGAGPYGVGIAQELWHRGIRFAIVGEPFELWFRHTLDVMLLRSDHRASDLYSRDGRYSFPRFLDEEENGRGGGGGGRTPVDTFRRYLRRVMAELPFPVRRARVTRLERPAGEGGPFLARCDDGAEIAARAAVLATGGGDHLHLPPELARLPAARVLHSWRTEAIQTLAGRRVLVVGGGQSAAESVDALRRANAVTWAYRTRPVFFSEPLRLPTPLFKALLAVSPAFFHLPPAVHRQLARAFFRPTITPNLRAVFRDPAVRALHADAETLALTPRGEILTSPLAGEIDNVVAATGFRYTLAGLPFLAESLRHRLGGPEAAPALDRDFQTAVPGLYLAGGIAQGAFGPAQRFILGSWHAARRIGRALAETAG